ncbi:MAG: hypothetical protein WAO28_00740 [Candidatus Microsaccharimonas sp.]
MIKGNSKSIKATLSGSFHRDPEGLERDYRELALNQCQVLSPRTLAFKDSLQPFVRHGVEEADSVGTIQKHHLQAIALSDFLWVHAPDGYIGVSTAMEIGYAYGQGIPIFVATDVEDEMINSFLTKVPSVFAAIEEIAS